MSDQEVATAYPERLMTPVLNFHLAMDVALGVDDDAILDAYGLQYHELEAIKASAVFKARLNELEKDLAKNGGTFRLKAQAQAEVLLQESFNLATDPETKPEVRADMIKQNVRWAGYSDPVQGAAGGGGGFQITINLGGDQAQGAVIDHETGDS